VRHAGSVRTQMAAR